MADQLKTQADLKLPEEFEGARVHLMVRESDPATRPVTIEQVGYHQDATDEVVWFELNDGEGGTLAEAQALIDGDVATDIREYLPLAPVAPEPAAASVETEKPLTSAQVKAANRKTKK